MSHSDTLRLVAEGSVARAASLRMLTWSPRGPQERALNMPTSTMMWWKTTRFMESFVVLSLGLATAIIAFGPTSKNYTFIERDPAYSLPIVTTDALSPMLAYTIILAVPLVACTVVEASRIAVAAYLVRKKKEQEDAFYVDDSPALKRCCDIFFALIAVSRRLMMVFLSSEAITLGLDKVIGRPPPNFFASCDYAGYGTLVSERMTPAARNSALAPYFAATVAGHFGDVSKCAQCAGSSLCADSELSSPSSRASVAFAGMLFAMLTVSLFYSPLHFVHLLLTI